MTREQMVAEFGATGVQNPMIMDLITLDPATDCVVMVMIESRPWGAHPRQLQQIEEKINRYLGGFLVQQYPQYSGKSVQIRLDCAEAPRDLAVSFVEAAQKATYAHGIEFVVKVTAG